MTGGLACSEVIVTSEEIEEGLYAIFRAWGVPDWRARAIARQEHPGLADRINARSARDGCRVAAAEYGG